MIELSVKPGHKAVVCNGPTFAKVPPTPVEVLQVEAVLPDGKILLSSEDNTNIWHLSIWDKFGNLLKGPGAVSELSSSKYSLSCISPEIENEFKAKKLSAALKYKLYAKEYPLEVLEKIEAILAEHDG
jgi:hypothetical protein